MKRACWTIGFVLVAGLLLGQPKTAEYKTMTGQLFLRTTAGGSALFQTQGNDYDVWLPRTPALSSLASGTTVTIEGVYTTDTSNGLEAPVIHPYKITVKGRVIDLSLAFGWTGQAEASGIDAVSGATGSPRLQQGSNTRDVSRRIGYREDRDDDDDDDDDEHDDD